MGLNYMDELDLDINNYNMHDLERFFNIRHALLNIPDDSSKVPLHD